MFVFVGVVVGCVCCCCLVCFCLDCFWAAFLMDGVSVPPVLVGQLVAVVEGLKGFQHLFVHVAKSVKHMFLGWEDWDV